MYFCRVALSTTKSAYRIPFSPALHPYPMSTCMTSPNFFGLGTGLVGILVLSMVDTSPNSMTGSLSMDEMWKLFLKHVLRCGMMFSVFLYPRSFRSESTLRVLDSGSTSCGLSWGRM